MIVNHQNLQEIVLVHLDGKIILQLVEIGGNVLEQLMEKQDL
nr:MAG TPA: hypothetical protein [Bacteriophage sp.]